MALSLSDALLKMRMAFDASGIEDAGFEAKALLTGLLEFSTLDIAIKTDLILKDEQVVLINKAIRERLSGKPVYRILGWREFYGLKFELSEETLEPRSDTETLVDAILPISQKIIEERGSCSILDLGTGTGAIALSILHNCEGATAVGVDVSDGALKTARQNSKQLGLADRFTALRSNWFSNVDGMFDIVVSNPPYISAKAMGELSIEVGEHDPHLALHGGDDGLDAYRLLAEQSVGYLKAGGTIGLEIGFDQNDSVKRLFLDQDLVLTGEYKDLGGRDRVLSFGSCGK
jgi:release factor glutamine methyltransferase